VLDRFSAAWRESYVTSEAAKENSRTDGECVFCSLAASKVDIDSGLLEKTEFSYCVLNAFPYGSGHLLVLPQRHVADLSDLSDEEYLDFTLLLRRVVVAIEQAYSADGMNVGMNLGKAAGAGIPKHLHAHALPRWNGDTNFMTSIGETRVLPESLASTWNKVHEHLK
jgi:ATP adenylyltransferase